jgi:hypothetical protein
MIHLYDPLGKIMRVKKLFLLLRYLAVCNPMRYRIVLVESTPQARALKYILPATIFSFVFNIPKFLEVEVR